MRKGQEFPSEGTAEENEEMNIWREFPSEGTAEENEKYFKMAGISFGKNRKRE